MAYLHTGSTLQDLLNQLIELGNNTQSDNVSSGDGPVEQYTFIQKMDELRNSISGEIGSLVITAEKLETYLPRIGKSLDRIADSLEGVHDDEQLMDRLKMKVKANYADDRDTLVSFWEWLEASKEHRVSESPVDTFLEQVESDDNAP